MEYALSYEEYRESLKQGRLLGVRCKNCGQYAVPPRKLCSKCYGEEFEKVAFSGKGKIQTFTVIRAAPTGYAAPYIVSLVELDEGPWLIGHLAGTDADKATLELIGKKVSVGHKIIPADTFSGGERVTPIFSLHNNGSI